MLLLVGSDGSVVGCRRGDDGHFDTEVRRVVVVYLGDYGGGDVGVDGFHFR